MSLATSEQFERFYHEELEPVLREIDARRVRILRTFFGVLLGCIGILVAGLIIVSAGVGPGAGPVVLIVGAIAAVIITCLTWWLMTRGYRDDFKRRVIGPIARFVHPSLEYHPGSCISESAFRRSRIFLTGVDRYRGEDYVSGRIGETDIQFSEIHAEYKTTSTDSKGRTKTSYHTIFKGLFFIADFHKDFRGVTVVLPDVAERHLGWLGQKLQEWNFTRSEELVKLEDPDFERRFVVYADDQVEARYVLSSSLMRRIVDFQDRTGCAVFLSFVASEVYVAVTTGENLFEPGYLRSVEGLDAAAEFLSQVELATEIVDDLSLNTRIWSKG